jgi:hypothetical protein
MAQINGKDVGDIGYGMMGKSESNYLNVSYRSSDDHHRAQLAI